MLKRVSFLGQMLRDQTVAVTTDAWTSTANSAFSGLAVSWIDSSWKLQNLALGITAFPGKHSGDRILRDLVANLRKFDVEMDQVCVEKEGALRTAIY
jgi:hypothetical protein